jgi:hypothetical protein
LLFTGGLRPLWRLIFAINDFDETLPAPWEWDIKRLAASFVVAACNNGFTAAEARESAQACVRSYRERMRKFSKMGVLDFWYFSLDMEAVLETFEDDITRERAKKRFAKARDRDVLDEDFPEMVTFEDGRHRIRDNPPLIYHFYGEEEAEARVREAFEHYRSTLAEDRRVLLDRIAPSRPSRPPSRKMASSQFLVRIDNENKYTMAAACGSLAREWLESGGLLSPARA